ncbi:uncharacterized protein BXIN_0909 [Babesia sp. Xinjiang]|uniref:uncharacterized protein n=1 Tax=Babesia sp. Xinjiang TaxID=462227 RepID=UPI000A243CBF|nr:uncharacterized protein BXIN_0909 [Babesia sp. Xinjiang]ORM42056.1 hypothetical protein BXIN_0909 [Babesia sp. Xinjiang]
MGHKQSRIVLCRRRRRFFKYFVLCIVERKPSCKIFLAFRVPSESLSVDYTISDAELLLQHGFRVSERNVEEYEVTNPKRGPVHVDPEAADALDHYCGSNMLCILKRYHCPDDRSQINIKKRTNNEIRSLQRLRRSKNVVTL